MLSVELIFFLDDAKTRPTRQAHQDHDDHDTNVDSNVKLDFLMDLSDLSLSSGQGLSITAVRYLRRRSVT